MYWTKGRKWFFCSISLSDVCRAIGLELKVEFDGWRWVSLLDHWSSGSVSKQDVYE